MTMASETTNHVLQALPEECRAGVLASCERIDMAKGLVLHRDGERTTRVFFPETAVISTLAIYRDGSVIEMANVGREACTGVNLVLGHSRQLNINEVQVEGSSLEMSADDFTSLKSALPEFERALFSNVQAIFYQVMVSGACNGAHSARQRLSRWLLTMDDRNDDAEMQLTHEFLAEILGLRRATVSEAASRLRDEGLIDYSRGVIRITDRSGLRSASCECYDRVRAAHRSLLPKA